jgi:hypothetical protein
MHLLLALAITAAPGPTADLLVVSSPGAPGTTAEAQPTMDAFASALSGKAGGTRLRAVYEPSEMVAVARLQKADAALALVSLPFFLKYEKQLRLTPRLQPAPKGRAAGEVWTLVAKKGRVHGPASLDGLIVVSSAGYAPAFVLGPALSGFGPVPKGVKVTPTTTVLSALRRVAAGDARAVLLDGEQGAALQTLPFATDLEAVAKSPPLPPGILASVAGRLPAKALADVERALAALPQEPAGKAALEGVQTERFVPVDAAALEGARRAYAAAAR